MDNRLLLQMTADIVASHASMNELAQSDLLGEIDQVYNKLANLAGGIEVEEGEMAPGGVAEPEEINPVLPFDALFCVEMVFFIVFGWVLNILKRHLASGHDLKPGQYRKMYGIPAGTPLVAKDYSEARKKMAQDLNLAERLVKARAARGKKKS